MKSSRFLLIISLIISVIGILSIYGSTYQKGDIFFPALYQRQISWVALGLAVFYFISRFNYRQLWDAAYFLYGSVIFLLSLVFISGLVRLGAQRWLKIAWFNLQPSEIAKPVLAIFLARYLSSKTVDNTLPLAAKFGIVRALILPFIFISIPMALVIEQPDLGSGIMLFIVFMVMLYISGVRLKYIFVFLLMGALVSPVLWSFLRDYQKDRLMVFLNPNIDPLGAGYTVIQSKIAIGSGGIFGRGWLAATQSQLHFLPESHTDFIFASFAESWGFLGVCVLFILYYLLIRRGIIIGFRARDNFGRLLALGISFLFSIQVLVNIAMNMGVAPVVGLPLPFLSYGGSSMVVTFASLGILANIDKNRGY